MLRLRVTVVLSLLALSVGIAGTDWLSDRSANEPLAMPLVMSTERPAASRRSTVSPASHGHAVAALRSHQRRMRPGGAALPDQLPHEPPTAVAVSPELVPLDMPTSRDLPYDRLRGHLDGRVVVHVSVDGGGRVTAASVAESSGDAVLDEHALRSVRAWRFDVPPDHPAGLSADLPMRFSSHDDPVASVP